MPLRLREVATTPDGMISRMRNLARNLAVKEFPGNKFGGFQPRGSEYGFADLRPTHIRVPVGGGFTTCFGRWTHPLLGAAGALTNWYDTSIHQDSIVMYYGMFNNNANPTITEIQHFLGGEDLPLINLNQWNGQLEPQSYFELGYVIGPKQQARADLVATGATVALTEEIGYIGEILALRRYLLAQSALAP